MTCTIIVHLVNYMAAFVFSLCIINTYVRREKIIELLFVKEKDFFYTALYF